MVAIFWYICAMGLFDGEVMWGLWVGFGPLKSSFIWFMCWGSVCVLLYRGWEVCVSSLVGLGFQVLGLCVVVVAFPALGIECVC